MGGGERNPYPTFQTFITGIDTPFAEGGTALLRCNETGCFGTCKADQLIYLTTRGGFYNDNPMEMGSRYIWAMCDFFGIPRYDCVAGDGLDTGVRPVEEILEDAKKEIDRLLAEF